MSLSDWVVSWLRTLAAVWVPTGATLLAKIGIDLPVDEAVVVATAVLISAWYTIVRALEARWPWIGALLLVRRQPTYQAKSQSKSGRSAR